MWSNQANYCISDHLNRNSCIIAAVTLALWSEYTRWHLDDNFISYFSANHLHEFPRSTICMYNQLSPKLIAYLQKGKYKRYNFYYIYIATEQAD